LIGSAPNSLPEFEAALMFAPLLYLRSDVIHHQSVQDLLGPGEAVEKVVHLSARGVMWIAMGLFVPDLDRPIDDGDHVMCVGVAG